ncbi:MAG: malonic semialdehyde reductase [Rhodospirillaceae bacterium]
MSAAAPALSPIDPAALDQLFRSARTHNSWQDKPVTQDSLEALYDLLRWAPTSMNCSPARFVFVTSAEGKAKLEPALAPGNKVKTAAAPVTVIIANDPRFHDNLPSLFPAYDAKPMFEENDALREETAMRNGTLQGGYLIMAARALGLDCGPMSGFDKAKVNEAFFAENGWQANFLCNLGYGDPEGLYPRGPRLDFGVACQVV